VILHAATLPGWRAVPLAALLSADLDDAPVFMENDANLGAVAEYARGARAGCDPLIYLTISTGIGGGAIINGRLFTGWRGLGFEPGHMLVPLEDARVVKLEQVASGTALGARARARLLNTDADSRLRALDGIDGAAVGSAALAGDALALEVVAFAAERLGYGVVNLLHLFNPQAVILGGGVMLGELGRLIVPLVAGVVGEQLLDGAFNPADAPVISTSTLGDDVCLIGAAQHALNGLMGER
jgi:glucokinase